MQNLLVDTNILVRFVSSNPRDQAEEVADLFDAVDEGRIRLTIPAMVVAEAVYILTKFYGNAREDVAKTLTDLISSPGFQSSEQDRMIRALRLFGSNKIDFVDCYLAAASILDNATVVSFDQEIGKFHGVTCKRPKDVRI